jgi:predicted DsbA family dithiol-disulfide isomerase
MQVEIWSDMICPWCYIGKRRFEMALTNFAHHDQVNIIWRSFELDPNFPAQYSETLNTLLINKYGVSPEQAAAMNLRVTALAQKLGLAYHLEQARPGNTLDAHRLLHFSVSKKQANQAIETIMHGYFSETLAIGDRESLIKLAPTFGVSEAEARTVLESDQYVREVRADEAQAAQLGISGVPAFVIDGKIAVSGAQSVDEFSLALERAWAA